MVASFLPANLRRPDIGIPKANLKEQLESSGLKNSGPVQCEGEKGHDENGVTAGLDRRPGQLASERKRREWKVWRGSCKVSETADPSSDPMNKGFS